MEPNQNQMQNSPFSTVKDVQTSSTHKKGPIIATLIIVLVLVLAALYLFASMTTRETPTPSVPNTVSQVSTEATDNQAMVSEVIKPITNTSDDLGDINADLNNALNNIDKQTF